jgi:hypothetical protein
VAAAALGKTESFQIVGDEGISTATYTVDVEPLEVEESDDR